MRALRALLATNRHPSVSDVVSVIARHPRDQRAVLAACRANPALGPAFAGQVAVQASVSSGTAAGFILRPGSAMPSGEPGPPPAEATERSEAAEDSESTGAGASEGGTEVTAPVGRDAEVAVRMRQRLEAIEFRVSHPTTRDGSVGASVSFEPPHGRVNADTEVATRGINGSVLRASAGGSVERGPDGPVASAHVGGGVDVVITPETLLRARSVFEVASDGKVRFVGNVEFDVLEDRVRRAPMEPEVRRQVLSVFAEIRHDFGQDGGDTVQGGVGGVFD